MIFLGSRRWRAVCSFILCSGICKVKASVSTRVAAGEKCQQATALPPEDKTLPCPSSTQSASSELPGHGTLRAGSHRSPPETKRFQAGPAAVSMTNRLIFFNEKMILHLSKDREIGGGLQ